MKLLVVVFCVVGASIVQGHEKDPKEGKDMLRKMSQKCKEKENASDDDVERLVEQQMPNTPEGKCLSACMQEQVGIIDEENKYSPEAMIEVTRMIVDDDPDKMKAVEEIAEACRPTAHEDRCELSVKIVECMVEQAKARGYDPNA